MMNRFGYYLPDNINKNCGIYRIKNLRNGKCYIGSSVNISARKSKHLRNLKKGKHHCDHLQSAWNKEPDKSVFEFQVFIFCKKEELKTIEQNCFDFMKPEYNSSLIAYRPEITIFSRMKMSDAKIGKPSNNKGKKLNDAVKNQIGESVKKNHKGRKIVIEITTATSFNSIREAANFFKLKPQSISAVCRGIYSQTKGFRFKYRDNENGR